MAARHLRVSGVLEHTEQPPTFVHCQSEQEAHGVGNAPRSL